MFRRLTVGVLKQNLSVDTTRTNESRVKSINLVGGHDDLDVSTVVEAIELIEKLEHGTLDFTLTARG